MRNLLPVKDLRGLETSGGGLRYQNTPAAEEDEVLRKLVELDQPELTIQTLLYLNGEHPRYYGLPNTAQALPDLPDGPGIVLPTEFDGTKLVALESPPPERDALASLFTVLKREADDLRGDNSLGNIPQAIQKAVQYYAASLPDEYDDLDPILVGAEGKQLATKYYADGESIQRENPAQAGLIEALLILHTDLIERLPKWADFVTEIEGEPEISDDELDVVRDELQEIIDEWSAPPVPVDEIIPKKLSLYQKGLGRSREGTLAALHALGDVIYPILRYACTYTKDIVVGALEGAKPALQKILTYGVIGSFLELTALLPCGAVRSRGASIS